MPEYYRSESEIRAALEKKIGGPVVDVIWGSLQEEGYINEVLLECEGAFHLLLSRYRRIEKIYRAGSAVAGSRSTQKPFPLPQASPPAKEDAALCRVLAAEVSRMPTVKRFRREVLGDNLLKLDEVEEWIFSIKRNDADHYSLGNYIDGLSYHSPKKRLIQYTNINPNGVLGRLKGIVKSAINICPAWSEENAVTYILTGLIPIVSKVSYGITLYSSMAACRVTLNFDARITPQELAKEYGKIRRQFLGSGHVKPINKKHLELAAYSSENIEDLTWEKLMRKWNKAFPEWHYDDRRLFRRDANAAINKLLYSKVDPVRIFNLCKKQEGG